MGRWNIQHSIACNVLSVAVHPLSLSLVSGITMCTHRAWRHSYLCWRHSFSSDATQHLKLNLLEPTQQVPRYFERVTIYLLFLWLIYMICICFQCGEGVEIFTQMFFELINANSYAWLTDQKWLLPQDCLCLMCPPWKATATTTVPPLQLGGSVEFRKVDTRRMIAPT